MTPKATRRRPIRLATDADASDRDARRHAGRSAEPIATPHVPPLDGILLLDKPQGLSSNQALQRVRHLFRAEKGGHTGSLDPLATGLLPVCFGEATKIAGGLLGARKAYDTVARLGHDHRYRRCRRPAAARAAGAGAEHRHDRCRAARR